jgi:hypothetical protein
LRAQGIEPADAVKAKPDGLDHAAEPDALAT